MITSYLPGRRARGPAAFPRKVPSVSQEASMEARTMKVQGQRTVYRVVGEGQPLVFLHAWSLGGHSYRHCLEGLATNGWQVFAPALPGFGGTSSLLPHADSGLSAYAEWVAAFVGQEIGKRPVALLGHSLGGGIAIQTAHDHPDLVDRLVLINSVGGASWTRKGEIVRGVAERPMWDWALHLASDLLPPRQLTGSSPL